MKLIGLGAAALNQTPLDWQQNLHNIQKAIKAAREKKVSILCLPELCITGYGCEDGFLSSDLAKRAMDTALSLAKETIGMIVSFGLPVLFQGSLYNCACLAADGQIAGFVGKQHLAGEGVHYEPRWFKPWPEHVVRKIEVNGETYPIGDLIFDLSNVQIGFEICEDAWVANRPGAEMALQGVDIILNPSASHFAFDKFEARKRIVLEGARAMGVGYIYANLLGNEAGRIIYDGGCMIASCGKMLSTGRRFSFTDVDLTVAQVDFDQIQMKRAKTGSYRPDFAQCPERVVKVDFDFPEVEPIVPEARTPDWENGDYEKEEEFSRAVSLGLFDYLRKSRSRGFVVSLSGGADSSAVACLAALAIQMAWKELGEKGLKAKLGYLDWIVNVGSPEEVISRMLTCIYQGTSCSSSATRNSADGLSAELNAKMIHFEVEDLVSDYVEGIERVLERKLAWETDDIALQNIQARVRGPGAWMIANLENALLLATSNRSEAAVGYATMDGDTCGGLSPIAGIDKAFLRQWLAWMETKGPFGYHPVKALGKVNCLKPTAELRPQVMDQTDETDLMPYPFLDAIERLAIRDKRSPLESYKILSAQFTQYESKQIRLWIKRFFTLWSQNQWKRERYAPSFHLDDENLDPKTWCRFPILSGGFAEELKELED